MDFALCILVFLRIMSTIANAKSAQHMYAAGYKTNTLMFLCLYLCIPFISLCDTSVMFTFYQLMDVPVARNR